MIQGSRASSGEAGGSAGDRVVLRCGRLTAELWPAVGGSLGAFHATLPDGSRLDLVRPAELAAVAASGPLAMGSFPLVPFSGRIREGRFAHGGTEVRLPRNFAPSRHAIHGQGWQQPWQLLEATPTRAMLEYRHDGGVWPFPYRARQIIALEESGLVMRMELTSTGDRPMPAGIGHHPYFPRTPAARVVAAVEKMWMADAEVMPTALVVPPPDRRLDAGVVLDRVALDNVFTGWTGRAEIAWPERGAGLTVAAQPPLRFLVVYSPPGQDFFCVEPISHVPDAVNLAPAGVPDTGLVDLAPGETLAGEMELRPALPEG
jgi:aldose 1-epimerase